MLQEGTEGVGHTVHVVRPDKKAGEQLRKSRWSGGERRPVPLQPFLVVEVSADHITGELMRHGARLIRWRTDKPPTACTMDQTR